MMSIDYELATSIPGATRRDYLNDLADEYGVDRHTVYELANLLGPNEDFDGLVTELQDFADMMD